jgi:hypothetical protein
MAISEIICSKSDDFGAYFSQESSLWLTLEIFFAKWQK